MIDAALKRLAMIICERIPNSWVAETVSNEGCVHKLVVSTDEAPFRIEATPVLRPAAS